MELFKAMLEMLDGQREVCGGKHTIKAEQRKCRKCGLVVKMIADIKISG